MFSYFLVSSNLDLVLNFSLYNVSCVVYVVDTWEWDSWGSQRFLL